MEMLQIHVQVGQQGYDPARFESVVDENYHCSICINVLKNPVECRRNEHYFCTPCITKHLQQNAQTCPSCREDLTFETLKRPPRIVTRQLSQLNIRCDYFARGCREVVHLADLQTHVVSCGFSPVMCSNEGCGIEVNRRDKIYHETEVCELRKVKYHDCVEIRKEIDDIKKDMREIIQIKEQLNQISCNEEKIMKNMERLTDYLQRNITKITMSSNRAAPPTAPEPHQPVTKASTSKTFVSSIADFNALDTPLDIHVPALHNGVSDTRDVSAVHNDALDSRRVSAFSKVSDARHISAVHNDVLDIQHVSAVHKDVLRTPQNVHASAVQDVLNTPQGIHVSEVRIDILNTRHVSAVDDEVLDSQHASAVHNYVSTAIPRSSLDKPSVTPHPLQEKRGGKNKIKKKIKKKEKTPLTLSVDVLGTRHVSAVHNYVSTAIPRFSLDQPSAIPFPLQEKRGEKRKDKKKKKKRTPLNFSGVS